MPQNNTISIHFCNETDSHLFDLVVNHLRTASRGQVIVETDEGGKAEIIEGKPPSWCCHRCHSTNVQDTAWIRTNTGEVVDTWGDHKSPGTRWCEDCENEDIRLIEHGKYQAPDPTCEHCQGDSSPGDTCEECGGGDEIQKQAPKTRPGIAASEAPMVLPPQTSETWCPEIGDLVLSPDGGPFEIDELSLTKASIKCPNTGTKTVWSLSQLEPWTPREESVPGERAREAQAQDVAKALLACDREVRELAERYKNAAKEPDIDDRADLRHDLKVDIGDRLLVLLGILDDN